MVFYFLFFWILRVYLPFLHKPITAMGDIFQWVVRFQPRRCLAIFLLHLPFFLLFLLLGRCQKNVFNLKWWQLSPKIYPRDFIDFWFNCVRLLNHVKVTPQQAFYTWDEVSSQQSNWSPFHASPLSMSSICCVIASGQQQRLIGTDSRGPPYYGGMQKQKQTSKNRKPKIDSQSIKHCSWTDNIWT